MPTLASATLARAFIVSIAVPVSLRFYITFRNNIKKWYSLKDIKQNGILLPMRILYALNKYTRILQVKWSYLLVIKSNIELIQ